jgi:glutamate dehydrogenase (NAD(P)+)
MDTIPSLYEAFEGADGLGPFEVMHIGKRAMGLRAVVVVDNLARGPALTPLRLTLSGTTDEALRLARTVTLANALADLPHGGAAGIVAGDPSEPLEPRLAVLSALGTAMAPLRKCVPIPDMGMSDADISCVARAFGRGAGLDVAASATAGAEGLSAAVHVALQRLRIAEAGARVAILGHGAVGRVLAELLVRRGMRLVAAADRMGLAADPAGLDLAALHAARRGAGTVAGLGPRGASDPMAIADIESDVLVLAGRPDALDVDGAARVATRLVVEGAYRGCGELAEQRLASRGIPVVPDIAAATGGLLLAARDLDPAREADGPIGDVVGQIVARVIRDARARKASLREAALGLARRRLPGAPRRRRPSASLLQALV